MSPIPPQLIQIVGRASSPLQSIMINRHRDDVYPGLHKSHPAAPALLPFCEIYATFDELEPRSMPRIGFFIDCAFQSILLSTMAGAEGNKRSKNQDRMHQGAVVVKTADWVLMDGSGRTMRMSVLSVSQEWCWRTGETRTTVRGSRPGQLVCSRRDGLMKDLDLVPWRMTRTARMGEL